MKKMILFFLLFLAIAIGVGTYFYTTKKSVTRNQNDLIVGTNASYAPFEYIENGNIVGFEIDIVRAIGSYLGKEIIFKDMAFDSVLMEAQSGRINMIAAALTPTPERSKKVLFTTPYLTNDSLVIITLASETPKSVDDLQGKSVIVNDGYTAETYMRQQKNITLSSLATPAEAFLALTSNRAYAYVSARSAVQPFFDRYGSNAFNIVELPVSDSYALAIPNIYPDIFEQVQNALNALEKNGTLTTIKQKWHLDFKS